MMSPYPYLEKFFGAKKLEALAEWKEFFIHFSSKTEEKNRSAFEAFLKKNKLSFTGCDELTARLNERLALLEGTIQGQEGIKDFSQAATIEKIVSLARRTTDSWKGLFLTEGAARGLLDQNPTAELQKEMGLQAYDKLALADPLFILAVGRYSEDAQWNKRHLSLLGLLSPKDFEWREVRFLVVSHSVFPATAKQILERKCFNTHDKIVGAHILSTLPPTFDTAGKAPILRTVTKMMHYHREMELFNRAFQEIHRSYPAVFGPKLASLLQACQYNAEAPLFNTHDVIEGLANLSIDEKIKKWAKDFPDLQPWAEVHDVGHWVNVEEAHATPCRMTGSPLGTFISLSLWRLTSWWLYGHREHSLKMTRDAVLAAMLVEKIGKERAEEGVIASLIDGSQEVTSALKRLDYAASFDFFKTENFPEAVLIHHIDADGLTGGHVTARALEKKGGKVHRYALEMFFPDVIKGIAAKHPGLPLFIVDLGTELASHLSSLPQTPAIYILDHHSPGAGGFGDKIKVFNPRLWGLAADMEACSAINAYYFSEAYTGSTDLALSALGGATGDGMLKRNKDFKGLDFRPYAMAVSHKKISPVTDGKVTLFYQDTSLDFQKFINDYINPAGSVGYCSGGVDLAYDLLDQTVSLKDSRFQELEALKQKKYAEVIGHLYGSGFQVNEKFIAFNVGEGLDPLSLKEIGNFLEYLLHERQKLPFPIPDDKYLFGAQKVPDSDLLKVSMRVGDALAPEILAKEKPSFLEITRIFPHSPGGIHALSAAVLIPESQFDDMLACILSFLNQ